MEKPGLLLRPRRSSCQLFFAAAPRRGCARILAGRAVPAETEDGDRREGGGRRRAVSSCWGALRRQVRSPPEDSEVARLDEEPDEVRASVMTGKYDCVLVLLEVLVVLLTT